MTPEQQPEISRSIFREANDAFFVLRPTDLRILDVNPAAQRLTGRRRKELLAMSLEDLVHARDAAAITELVRACQSTENFVGSARYLMTVANGTLTVQLSASRIHTEPDTLALLVVRDISRQQALEEQLDQARRLEAIGRLSAGVAHEFNNLLTIINGYSALVLESGNQESPRAKMILEIQRAGRRATSFTRQLLDFGSHRESAESVLDLSAVVANIKIMLVPLLGEGVEIETLLTPEPLLFEADLVRAEQVIVNLAANAGDAMPAGGKLTIETFAVELTQDDVATRPGLRPGPHVVLRTTDTGCGMNVQTITRAFEPFFTTKNRGDGTGLGLAMVYGAVKQSRGHVAVESEPGRGTTVTIHFPAMVNAMHPSPAPATRTALAATGTENILLVEDDNAVRCYVRGVLQMAGYTVFECGHGEAALSLSEDHAGPIDLVLTDYLMPGMRGDELGRRLSRQRPGIRIVLMSGCATLDGIGEDQTLADRLLRKPFSPQELTERVRAELDS